MPSVAVTRRHDLTDAQWAVLAPLLPAPSRSGCPPKWEKRQLIDGIRWRIRIGAPWRDIPPQYAPWPTIYGLFRRWQRDGTWDRILAALQAAGDAAGRIGWTVSVNSMTVALISMPRVPAVTGICKKSRPGVCIPSRLITRWAARAAG